jgi:DNA-directed RNA polymerase subunit beta'
MADYLHEKNASDFDAIQLSIAGPDEILSWSHGEVLKPETINYRTQKPEKDGLFDERIFGPTKDFECYCGKYKGAHYRGVTCDRCGVLVARAIVRRERMGHIALAVPATHVWFLRRTPSSIGLVLNMTAKNLEKITYFANYAVTSVDEDKKEEYLREMETAYENNKAAIKQKFEEMASQEGEDEQALAQQRNQELEEAEQTYTTERSKLESLVEKALLSEQDYRELRDQYSDVFSAQTGAEAIKTLLRHIDLDQTVGELREAAQETQGQRQRKILKRLKKLEGMQKAGIKPEWMIVEHVPVIPPELRPMVQLTGGRFATSDLNDLYRRVINRNNRLKKLIDLNAPEVICRNEMRMLQEAVDALIDNSHVRGGRAVNAAGGRRKLKSLSDQLRGKQGRFRQNLLGKRVDYSGRSVIVSGPDLQLHQCGLPKMMALDLFKPFVIGKLMEDETAHNVKAASQMIDNNEPIIWDALDAVIEGKYVLLNRAPTLHRLGVQAFQPVLVEGKAIQLHPLVCGGFNADFDGDQMAVHIPLSDEAQTEAREIMASDKNLLYPLDGTVMVSIMQDMVLGAYYMTYQPPSLDQTPQHSYASESEAIYAYEAGSISLQTPNSVLCDDGETRITTVGRILFNQILPDDFSFRNHTFIKSDLTKLATEIFNRYGMDMLGEVANRIKETGFEYATNSGLSTGMDDYIIPDAKTKIVQEGEDRASEIDEQYDQGLITEEERYRLTVDAWLKAKDETEATVKEDFQQQENSTTIITLSGARAKMGAINQIIGMIGLRQDVYGNTIELPIKSNYKEGLDVLEYFTDARASRKVLIDTALKTADSGYLTRRLVDVSQDVFTVEDDCGDEEGVLMGREEAHDLAVGFAERLSGRVAAEDLEDIVKNGELIGRDQAEMIEASDRETVRVRSLLSCRSVRGVCRQCYGQDLSTGEMVNNRVPVGVMAAQAIGEPGTQLTLRTFHGGGGAGEDITQGLPRVNELFEAQNPKGQAQLADMEGSISIGDNDTSYTVRLTPTSKPEHSYDIQGMTAAITDGDTVKPGDVIATSEDDRRIVSANMSGTAHLSKNQIKVTAEKMGAREYTVPKYRNLLVQDGEQVTAGQRLTSGSVNVQDLLNLTDTSQVQRYIINEVQRVFSLQGTTIADKHLEVIVRQMTSRVQIENPGDSLFVTGDVVTKARIIQENQQLRANNQQPIAYKQLLLGISKTSLSTESWLSAASFQDTTRILINAATAGSIDHLYGLKENVIIGRKIPVGTGYQTDADSEAEAEVDE